MLSITNLTRRNPPVGGLKIPWQKIKEKVLGKKYELSLVLAGNSLMKKLNNQYRKKKQPASVLSFPLSKKQGEIFINLGQKNHSPLFLFIHALLHLKGFKHSAKMKLQEEKLMKHYGAKYTHRH